MPPPSPSEPRGAHGIVPLEGHRERLWLFAALAGLWVLAINQLRVEWTINPQYSYGWVVPLLALYLYGERWRSRPEPSPGGRPAALLILAGAGAALLLPIRLLQEAAAEWRLMSWALTATVVGLNLLALQAAGGGRWVRHFWFPVCFIFVAVAWPMSFETHLVQTLMRTVASTCAEILWWSGMPALQEGNVIRVGGTAVGVEEACSGVRSLQTTIMIALFLGELFRFSLWRRAALLGGGLLAAFVFNLARAMTLVWLASSRGPEELEHWHDAIGWAVLTVSLAALLGLATLLRRPEPDAAVADPPPVSPGGRFHPLVLQGLLAWLLLVETGTQLWYWAHERGLERTPPWSIRFPIHRPAYRDWALAPRTRVILRYDDSHSASWKEDDGSAWSMIFLRWEPGSASARLPRNHTPEVCLQASGAQLEADLGVRPMQIGAQRLSIHRYIFTTHGQPLHVFYARAEDGTTEAETASLHRGASRNRRIEDALAGRRYLGQQVLEIAVAGLADMDEAEAALSRFLQESLQSRDQLAQSPEEL